MNWTASRVFEINTTAQLNSTFQSSIDDSNQFGKLEQRVESGIRVSLRIEWNRRLGSNRRIELSCWIEMSYISFTSNNTWFCNKLKNYICISLKIDIYHLFYIYYIIIHIFSWCNHVVARHRATSDGVNNLWNFPHITLKKSSCLQNQFDGPIKFGTDWNNV